MRKRFISVRLESNLGRPNKIRSPTNCFLLRTLKVKQLGKGKMILTARDQIGKHPKWMGTFDDHSLFLPFIELLKTELNKRKYQCKIPKETTFESLVSRKTEAFQLFWFLYDYTF